MISNGRVRIGIRRTWLGLWFLGAIGLLVLLNLGCNGCGNTARDAVEEAKDVAAEAAATAGEVIEEGAEAVGDAVGVDPSDFEDALVDLRRVGYPIESEAQEAWVGFATTRRRYFGTIQRIADAIVAPPGPWSQTRRLPRRR